MPFDCTNLNNYISLRRKYSNVAGNLKLKIIDANEMLDRVERSCKELFSRTAQDGNRSSGYLASMYSMKLPVVEEHANVIYTLLKNAVERLDGQLKKANDKATHYGNLESRERRKKALAEKEEAEGKLG